MSKLYSHCPDRLSNREIERFVHRILSALTQIAPPKSEK